MEIKTHNEIIAMSNSGEILSNILLELKEKCKPGISTLELNNFAEELTKKYNSIPTFKGYRGFPSAICTSVNDEVIHGIPNKRKLSEGDILSIDMGITYKGWITDSAITIPVGKISKKAKKLINITQKALYLGLNQAKINNRLYDISSKIQTFAEENGYQVVKDFVGHGVGKFLHEEPSIPNYIPKNKNGFRNIKLIQGMTLAIEPMINIGTDKVSLLKNKWTVKTSDNKLSAHFEHTIALTKENTIILTIREDENIDKYII